MKCNGSTLANYLKINIKYVFSYRKISINDILIEKKKMCTDFVLNNINELYVLFKINIGIENKMY